MRSSITADWNANLFVLVFKRAQTIPLAKSNDSFFSLLLLLFLLDRKIYKVYSFNFREILYMYKICVSGHILSISTYQTNGFYMVYTGIVNEVCVHEMQEPQVIAQIA